MSKTPESKHARRADATVPVSTKPFEFAKRTSEIGFETTKRLAHDQIELGSAIATLGIEQLKSLRDLRAPKAFVKRQKTALSDFGTTAKGLFSQTRGTFRDARQAYFQLGKDLVSDLRSAKQAT